MDPGPKESDSFSWRRHKRERLLLAALSLRRTGELGVKDTPETPFSASTICHRPTLCHGYGHAHTHLWCLNLFSAIAAHQHTLLYCIIFYLCFFFLFSSHNMQLLLDKSVMESIEHGYMALRSSSVRLYRWINFMKGAERRGHTFLCV